MPQVAEQMKCCQIIYESLVHHVHSAFCTGCWGFFGWGDVLSEPTVFLLVLTRSHGFPYEF